MREKIIDFLKNQKDYISGEELAGRLKISRQALWKHMQELKNLGYEIAAVPHLGYRLESRPDRLFEFEIKDGLKAKVLGKKVYYFDTLTSTMDVAMQQGLEGAAEGTIILAESQTKGRGRLGRQWLSPKYKGLYLSVILRPKIMPLQVSILTLLSAVSLCEAIKKITGITAQIKWPNDILVNNKKLGGILTELNAEMDKVNFIVIGIGLNVNNDKKSLLKGASSLKEEAGQDISRVNLLQELLLKLEENYLLFQSKGPGVIVEKWRDYSITLGKRVKVHCQNSNIEGEASNIDTDGGLLIRKDSGLTVKVMAGDVVHCR